MILIGVVILLFAGLMGNSTSVRMVKKQPEERRKIIAGAVLGVTVALLISALMLFFFGD